MAYSVNQRNYDSGNYYAQPNNYKNQDQKISFVFQLQTDPEKHCAGIENLYYDKKMDWLYTASRDSTIKRWDHDGNFDRGYDAHLDWVTDLVVVDNKMITSSNDQTVRMWLTDPETRHTHDDDEVVQKHRPQKQRNKQTILYQHQDYVMSIALAQAETTLVSGGLRSQVILFDLIKGQQISQIWPPQNQLSYGSNDNLGGSCYAVDIGQQDNIIAFGNTDGLIRLFDKRTSKNQICKLVGHIDNIRCLQINNDGRHLASGSTDQTIKIWDLRQLLHVQNLHIHTDSVWCLKANDDFTTIFSGGRDKCLYRTNLYAKTSELIVEEESPIKSMAFCDQDKYVWLAVSQSGYVNKWNIPAVSAVVSNKVLQRQQLQKSISLDQDPSQQQTQQPQADQQQSQQLASNKLSRVQRYSSQHLVFRTARIIPARSVVDFKVLNDKQKILIKDSAGDVAIFDITYGAVVEDLSSLKFEEAYKHFVEPINVLSWFDVDMKLGTLTITLSYPRCLYAEFYKTDVYGENYKQTSDSTKAIYGQELIRGMLKQWTSDQGDQNTPSIKKIEPFDYTSLPQPPSILLPQAFLKISTTDSIHGNEKAIPQWVVEVVQRGPPEQVQQKNQKEFHVDPDETQIEQLPMIRVPQLKSPVILQIRKVAIYVVNKLREEYNIDCRARNNLEEDHLVQGPPLIEITCGGMVVPTGMSLASVHQFIYTEYYKGLQKSNQPPPCHQQSLAYYDSAVLKLIYRKYDPNNPLPIWHYDLPNELPE